MAKRGDHVHEDGMSLDGLGMSEETALALEAELRKLDEMDMDALLTSVAGAGESLFGQPSSSSPSASSALAGHSVGGHSDANASAMGTPASVFGGEATPSTAASVFGHSHASELHFMTLMSPYLSHLAALNRHLVTDENELLLTPIISPALTPSADFANLNLTTASSTSFSPLSSPALRPIASTSAASSSTIPAIKRTARRSTSSALLGSTPLSGSDRKKKIPPRSPYTIPRLSAPSPGGIDPLKISSPILRPLSSGITTVAGNTSGSGSSNSREGSSSMSPDVDPLAISPTSSTEQKQLRQNQKGASVFKVPVLPASKAAKATSKRINPNHATLDSRAVVSFAALDPMTPGMLMNIRSDDEKQPSQPNSSPTAPVTATTPVEVLDVDMLSEESAASTPVPPPKREPRRRRSVHSGSSSDKFVSPGLKPILPNLETATVQNDVAITKLTHNSNYRNLLDGVSPFLGLEPPTQPPPPPPPSIETAPVDSETKKEHHKVNEQRRRDSMKQCFDGLREVLPRDRFGEKNPSKERVLQFSREYILQLQQERNGLEEQMREAEQVAALQGMELERLRAEVEASRRKEG
ncbi:hypothetical protein BC830DRAFT_1227313 [Chytriomyces sp. MP71]|nr:hypothetical protein BC830DRAFT_1227313 [Chytriomyces sp. MP71]